MSRPPPRSMASSPFLFISSSRSSLALAVARVITLAAANIDPRREEERDSLMRQIEGARRKKVYSPIDRSIEVARPQQQLRFPSLLSLQEVILRRDGPGERLGLTLCYETDAEDGLTDIFIDDIHPDGLAAADGRLRLGDQIIQVSSKNYAKVPQIF